MTKIVRMLGMLVVASVLSTVGLGTVAASPAAAAQKYPTSGQTSVQVLELQQRLVKAKALTSGYITGYYGSRTTAGVKAFQKQAGLSRTGKVDGATTRALEKKTGKVSTSTVPGIDRRCKTSGRVLCVDKTRDKLFYLSDSTILQVMDARFGCAGMRTREGSFTIRRKSRHHVSSIYHTPMPYAMFFSGGQAVHYSSDFARRGYQGCSHGCVNIRDKSGIASLFDTMRVRDRVVVYRS